jgi:hypothetical protein
MPRTSEKNISPATKKRVGILRLSGKPSHVIANQLHIPVTVVWNILAEGEVFPSKKAIAHGRAEGRIPSRAATS